MRFDHFSNRRFWPANNISQNRKKKIVLVQCSTQAAKLHIVKESNSVENLHCSNNTEDVQLSDWSHRPLLDPSHYTQLQLGAHLYHVGQRHQPSLVDKPEFIANNITSKVGNFLLQIYIIKAVVTVITWSA